MQKRRGRPKKTANDEIIEMVEHRRRGRPPKNKADLELAIVPDHGHQLCIVCLKVFNRGVKMNSYNVHFDCIDKAIRAYQLVRTISVEK